MEVLIVSLMIWGISTILAVYILTPTYRSDSKIQDRDRDDTREKDHEKMVSEPRETLSKKQENIQPINFDIEVEEADGQKKIYEREHLFFNKCNGNLVLFD